MPPLEKENIILKSSEGICEFPGGSNDTFHNLQMPRTTPTKDASPASPVAWTLPALRWRPPQRLPNRQRRSGSVMETQGNHFCKKQGFIVVMWLVKTKCIMILHTNIYGRLATRLLLYNRLLSKKSFCLLFFHLWSFHALSSFLKSVASISPTFPRRDILGLVLLGVWCKVSPPQQKTL